MQYGSYTQSAFLMSVHREARINRIADGLRQVNPDIMALFWERHDASNAMYEELHGLIREGFFGDQGGEAVQEWLKEAKKNLPSEVCIKCESVLEGSFDEHLCQEAEELDDNQDLEDIEF